MATIESITLLLSIFLHFTILNNEETAILYYAHIWQIIEEGKGIIFISIKRLLASQKMIMNNMIEKLRWVAFFQFLYVLKKKVFLIILSIFLSV